MITGQLCKTTDSNWHLNLINLFWFQYTFEQVTLTEEAGVLYIDGMFCTEDNITIYRAARGNEQERKKGQENPEHLGKSVVRKSLTRRI